MFSISTLAQKIAMFVQVPGVGEFVSIRKVVAGEIGHTESVPKEFAC